MMKIVPDTNIFVAAGFNKSSHAYKILKKASEGKVALIWHKDTLDETRHILSKIPPLKWNKFQQLFTPDNECKQTLELGNFELISDYSDRKFAALAKQTSSVLISNDDHLLARREELDIEIKTPREFINT